MLDPVGRTFYLTPFREVCSKWLRAIICSQLYGYKRGKDKEIENNFPPYPLSIVGPVLCNKTGSAAWAWYLLGIDLGHVEKSREKLNRKLIIYAFEYCFYVFGVRTPFKNLTLTNSWSNINLTQKHTKHIQVRISLALISQIYYEILRQLKDKVPKYEPYTVLLI